MPVHPWFWPIVSALESPFWVGGCLSVLRRRIGCGSNERLLPKTARQQRSFLSKVGRWIRKLEFTNASGPKLVWFLLLLYWVVFFLWPLPSLSSPQGEVWRRIHLVSWLLLPEEWVALWFGQPPQFAFLDRVPLFAVAGVLWFWAFTWGRALLRSVGVNRYLRPSERAVFSLAAGTTLISGFMLLVGLAGLLRQRGLLWGVVLLSLVCWVGAEFGRVIRGGYFRRRIPLGGLGGAQPPAKTHQMACFFPFAVKKLGIEGPLWIWACVFIFSAVILLGAVLPPVEFDVREYHLQAPKEFFQKGRIFFVEHNVYANMPLGAEMLPLAAMSLLGDWWSGGLAGKLAQSGFTILVAASLLVAGGRLGHPGVGLTAAFLFLSTPWVVQISNLGLVEWAWGAYAFLAGYAWVLWYKLGEGQPRKQISPVGFSDPDWGTMGLLFLSGLFAGAAAGCKYPAVPFVVAPLILATGIRLVMPEWFGKWFGRSDPEARTTGRSFASGHGRAAKQPEDSPLAGEGNDKWSRSREQAEVSEQAAGDLGRGRKSPLLYRGVAFATLLLGICLGGGLWYAKNAWFTGNPVYPLLADLLDGNTRTPELTQRWTRAHRPPGYSGGELLRASLRVLWGSEWLSPLIWPSVFLGWRALPPALQRAAVAILAWWFGIWWMATHRIDRFWLPVLPMIALLGGFIATPRERWDRRLRIYAMALGTVWNLFVCTTVGGGYPHFFVSLNLLREDSSRVGPWVTYLNRHPEVGSVLLVGEAAVFDYQVPVLYNTCFDRCWLETLASGRDPEEFRMLLRQGGVTHLLVHWSEISRYRSPGNYGFCEFVSPELFERWEKAGILERVPEFANPPVVVYQVR
jgi:hypothetical protein